MKKINDINDLMVEQMRDMYNGEVKLDALLHKLNNLVNDGSLKDIMHDYQIRNEDQVMRLKHAFNEIYIRKRGETCDAMKAMIHAANQLVERTTNPDVRDAGIITALQHIIHYQIAGYGAICTYAKILGLTKVAETLHQNLEEEKNMDRKLAILAEERINLKAQPMIH